MLDQRERQDKQLLALAKELRTLERQRYITVKLEEPIQHGWMRFHVLAEKIGAHRDKSLLQDILAVIGIRVWSRTGDFRVWRKRRKKRVFTEVEHPVKVISVSQWERRRFPGSWKNYFRVEMKRHKKLYHPTYVFAHRGLFELRTEPWFTSEVTVQNPEVQARIVEIEQWILHRNLKPRLKTLTDDGGYWWDKDPRPNKLARIQLRETRLALQNYPEADRVPVECWNPISLQVIFLPA